MALPLPLVPLIIAAIFVVLLVVGFAQAPPNSIAALEHRFRILARVSRRQAKRHLRERIESVSERFPGRSYRWYLEWLITDLERAKR